MTEQEIQTLKEENVALRKALTTLFQNTVALSSRINQLLAMVNQLQSQAAVEFSEFIRGLENERDFFKMVEDGEEFLQAFNGTNNEETTDESIPTATTVSYVENEDYNTWVADRDAFVFARTGLSEDHPDYLTESEALAKFGELYPFDVTKANVDYHEEWLEQQIEEGFKEEADEAQAQIANEIEEHIGDELAAIDEDITARAQNHFRPIEDFELLGRQMVRHYKRTFNYLNLYSDGVSVHVDYRNRQAVFVDEGSSESVTFKLSEHGGLDASTAIYTDENTQNELPFLNIDTQRAKVIYDEITSLLKR